MTSLPILSSQTPNNGKIEAGKSGNNALNAEDVSNGAAPFGELLAKQLSPQDGNIKQDLLKVLALADDAQSAADLTDPNAAELRSDGIAIPVDLLASLQLKNQHMARGSASDDATEGKTTVLSALRGDAKTPDTATQRIAPEVEGKVKPDAHISSDKAGKHVDARDAHAAKSGPVADATFAAALHAEKKAAISTLTSKPDTVIQPAQANNTAAVGAPAATAPAAQSAATQVTISTPLGQPQWADDMSQKVTWMATQRTQSAQLHLNPAQLGPLEVSLKLNGDQATVQFTSAHAAVRDAIEQSIPRLRDMLADSGISLGNTTVSDQAPREQEQRGQAGRATGDNSADNSLEPETVQPQTITRQSRHDGVLDTFA